MILFDFLNKLNLTSMKLRPMSSSISCGNIPLEIFTLYVVTDKYDF